ncbi:MAG: nitroreductase family protein [Bacteroidales bacterium]
MSFHQHIITRRSIRKFTSRPVGREQLEGMLEAAMYAPSARNYQPWHFVVVQKRASLDRLSEIHPYASMLKTATAAILVCGDRNLEPNDNYNAQNCAAATQNLLLSAHETGIGSCWLGVYPRQERMKNISEYLKLPENIIPISLIALGYPAEQKETPVRFQPERIHYEQW